MTLPKPCWKRFHQWVGLSSNLRSPPRSGRGNCQSVSEEPKGFARSRKSHQALHCCFGGAVDKNAAGGRPPHAARHSFRRPRLLPQPGYQTMRGSTCGNKAVFAPRQEAIAGRRRRDCARNLAGGLNSPAVCRRGYSRRFSFPRIHGRRQRSAHIASRPQSRRSSGLPDRLPEGGLPTTARRW